MPITMDAMDRHLIEATQAGLPLCTEPYEALGDELGLSASNVRQRLARLLSSGAIRRIGAVPNHYALGYRANGMSVWDVEDSQVAELGRAVGALEFVSHCYRRPRHLPDWPYNLFAMLHGRDQSDVTENEACIAQLLGRSCRGHEVVYSTEILKKTGLRLRAAGKG